MKNLTRSGPGPSAPVPGTVADPGRTIRDRSRRPAQIV